MYINKKNIDFNYSPKVGKDFKGRPIRMRIDKLTLVGNIDNLSQENFVYEKLDSLSSHKYKKYRVQSIRGIDGKPYRKAVIIRNKVIPSPLLLRIDYFPINHKTGDLRLELHPQHLLPEEIDRLLCWLNKKLNMKLDDVLLNSWVTQVDVAVDIHSARLEYYIWGLKRSEKAEYFNENNGLPGLTLGSRRSQLYIYCYEKIDGYNDPIIRRMKRRSLMNIQHNDYDSFLRIEARFRPRKNIGNKNKSMLLKNLMQMENPFTRLTVYKKNLNLKLAKNGFLKSCPCNPSMVKLKHCIKLSTKTLRLSHKHLNLIYESQLPLFDINMVWGFWPRCITRLGSRLKVIMKK
ncbi:hypothetical protein FHC51_00580 [Leclercia sp. EC_58]|uniref:hypothetical protein n=1 Tax=Leclercia sp. EC_58 TaxID=2584090 RepID=UPI001C706771|nr:hypothetical protein [Leclercia sp. EC_58]MBW9398349.1 hypothetical protein [Leclercia sp. EC_58]